MCLCVGRGEEGVGRVLVYCYSTASGSENGNISTYLERANPPSKTKAKEKADQKPYPSKEQEHQQLHHSASKLMLAAAFAIAMYVYASGVVNQ